MGPEGTVKQCIKLDKFQQQLLLRLAVPVLIISIIGAIFVFRKMVFPSAPAGFSVTHVPREPVDTLGYRVNINTATLEELLTLPGIGKATALKIIQERELNGLYRSIDDLERVNGIGAKKIQNMRSSLTPIADPEVLVDGSRGQERML